MRRNGSVLIKPSDLILFAFFLIAALTAWFVLRCHRHEGKTICVTIEDKEYGRWSLDQDQVVSIIENGNRNVLVIRGGRARMTEADCPDLICVSHVPIQYVGETIICLPHKLVVSVESDGIENTGAPVDAISR